MKIYYSDCGTLRNVMGAKPSNANLAKALYVLENIWSPQAFMGIMIDERTILQIKPDSRTDYFYAELLNTKTKQIKWTIVSITKARRMIQCVYGSEPILKDPILKRSRWRVEIISKPEPTPSPYSSPVAGSESGEA
jgi:hypothetical protein